MKNKLALLLAVLFVLTLSCKGRNPNLSDKQLAEMTVESSEKEAETSNEQTVLPDTSYIPPVGTKYKENRMVNPAAPLVTLKVEIPTGEKKTLKLSDFGKTIEYTTLTLPNESDFFLSETSVSIVAPTWSQSSGGSTDVYQAGDFYITNDILAVRLFDKQGNFIQNLVESEFSGEKTVEKITIEVEGFKQGFLQDIFNNRCYLMKYSQTERAYGEYNLLTKQHTMVPAKKLPHGKYIDKNTRFSLYTGHNTPVLGISFAVSGDTLCRFTNHISISKDFKGKTMANSDRMFLFRSKDKLFFRQAYCDTIFRVESASHIAPAYRFDFGTKRVSINDGVSANTAGKLLPWKLIDFNNKLILIYTEGRDCPNCRKNKEVKFFCTQYDKNTGRATPIDIKNSEPENILIENDIDGGLPLSLYAMRTSESSVIGVYTKKQLTDVVKDKSISAEVAKKLKQQANEMKQNQLLIVSIK